MPILVNVSTLVTCRDEGRQSDLHPVSGGALVWTDDTIQWVGPKQDIPERFGSDDQRVVAGGQLVVPGLVDCHTQLAFGGWRVGECVMRCMGLDVLGGAQTSGWR